MKILGVSGSLKASSTNTNLIRAAAALAPVEVQIDLYGGLADLPHFSPDLDGDDPPNAVQQWRKALQSADAVLISTPEYAYGMPGSLKNALDWTVSSGEFVAKPVATLSASPTASGGARAHSSLVLTLTALSAVIVEGAQLMVPLVRTKLDENGHVHDPLLTEALKVVIDALLRSVAP